MTNCHYIPVLTSKECEVYLKKIYSLKSNWIGRNKDLPFYTLGMAAYLDGPTNEYFNLEKRTIYNRVLNDNFSELYNTLKHKLSIFLRTPCELYDKSSIPGFHIYMNHLGLKDSKFVHQPTPHLDIQFKYVFPEKGIKQEDFISFTLCLSCPEGCGLNIWEPEIQLPEDVLDGLTEKSFIDCGPYNPLSQYLAQSIYKKPTLFIPYKIGGMAIHNGVFYHYPVLMATKIPRITLQGHGVKKDGKFLLFW